MDFCRKNNIKFIPGMLFSKSCIVNVKDDVEDEDVSNLFNRIVDR